jgi:putative flavoprotein involved in K+ transport
VLVVGTGNSGHDIAQDLHAGGAKVTLVQRGPTLIVNIEPTRSCPTPSTTRARPWRTAI